VLLALLWVDLREHLSAVRPNKRMQLAGASILRNIGL
jgi:hypothetical protein